MTKQQLLASIMGIFVFAVLISACQPKAEPVTPSDDAMIEKSSESMEAAPEMMESKEESMMKEGQTITETQTYQSPAGPEEVGFSIVVDDEGTVTALTVENKAKAPISIQRQDAFIGEIEEVVVGKKLSELSDIDRVGGSSLTTGAFNEFLTEAKTRI